MADNVAVTPGTGATFATDDIGGIQYPRVKVTQGADGASVDVSSAAPLQVTLANGTVPSHAVTNAGTFATQVTSIAAGTNNIGDVDVLTVSGQTLAFNTGAASASTLRVAIADDSQNANGRAAAANSAPVVMSTEDLAVLTAIETATEAVATGVTPFFSLDLDETEEEIKGTAGRLYKIRITNRTTSPRYVKIYNATAANTTVGTTTPLDIFPVPANASDYTVLTESYPDGLIFDTALSIACTTGFANNDTGAPGANDVIVSAYYK